MSSLLKAVFWNLSASQIIIILVIGRWRGLFIIRDRGKTLLLGLFLLFLNLSPLNLMLSYLNVFFFRLLLLSFMLRILLLGFIFLHLLFFRRLLYLLGFFLLELSPFSPTDRRATRHASTLIYIIWRVTLLRDFFSIVDDFFKALIVNWIALRSGNDHIYDLLIFFNICKLNCKVLRTL